MFSLNNNENMLIVCACKDVEKPKRIRSIQNENENSSEGGKYQTDWVLIKKRKKRPLRRRKLPPSPLPLTPPLSLPPFSLRISFFSSNAAEKRWRRERGEESETIFFLKSFQEKKTSTANDLRKSHSSLSPSPAALLYGKKIILELTFCCMKKELSLLSSSSCSSIRTYAGSYVRTQLHGSYCT